MTPRPVEIKSLGGSERISVVMLIGMATVAFSLLYLISDVIELIQGAFDPAG